HQPATANRMTTAAAAGRIHLRVGAASCADTAGLTLAAVACVTADAADTLVPLAGVPSTTGVAALSRAATGVAPEPATAACPDSLLRFSRLRSARRSAACWYRSSRSLSNAL